MLFKIINNKTPLRKIGKELKISYTTVNNIEDRSCKKIIDYYESNKIVNNYRDLYTNRIPNSFKEESLPLSIYNDSLFKRQEIKNLTDLINSPISKSIKIHNMKDAYYLDHLLHYLNDKKLKIKKENNINVRKKLLRIIDYWRTHDKEKYYKSLIIFGLK